MCIRDSPIKQVELQELQHKLEETSDLVRGGRWPALTKTVTKCQSLLKKYQSKIIQELPNDKKRIAEKTFLELKENFDSLQDLSKSKDKYSFIATRRDALDKIGGLEEYFLPTEFPYSIPQEFDNLPRLLGRAKVNIKTSKGNMQAIVDGFNAPLTAGAFVDLSSKKFYNTPNLSIQFDGSTCAKIVTGNHSCITSPRIINLQECYAKILIKSEQTFLYSFDCNFTDFSLKTDSSTS